jgi:hypothetical protein
VTAERDHTDCCDQEAGADGEDATR